MTPATILMVDDEEDLVHLVRYNLEKEGFKVLFAYDATCAKDILNTHQPDLIILDLMLPDQSGFEVCKQIKQSHRTKHIPVIMLTARSSEEDRISGFEVGAEDYVVKPFSPRELVWRVKAMLGRTQQQVENHASGPSSNNNAKQADAPIVIGPLMIFPSAYRVLVDQEEIALTHIEFEILKMLAEQPHRVHTREQILDSVWQDSAEEVLDRTVDAHMKRLRSKLASARNLIETVRGVGYRLIQPVHKPAPFPQA